MQQNRGQRQFTRANIPVDNDEEGVAWVAHVSDRTNYVPEVVIPARADKVSGKYDLGEAMAERPKGRPTEVPKNTLSIPRTIAREFEVFVSAYPLKSCPICWLWDFDEWLTHDIKSCPHMNDATAEQWRMISDYEDEHFKIIKNGKPIGHPTGGCYACWMKYWGNSHPNTKQNGATKGRKCWHQRDWGFRFLGALMGNALMWDWVSKHLDIEPPMMPEGPPTVEDIERICKWGFETNESKTVTNFHYVIVQVMRWRMDGRLWDLPKGFLSA